MNQTILEQYIALTEQVKRTEVEIERLRIMILARGTFSTQEYNCLVEPIARRQAPSISALSNGLSEGVFNAYILPLCKIVNYKKITITKKDV